MPLPDLRRSSFAVLDSTRSPCSAVITSTDRAGLHMDACALPCAQNPPCTANPRTARSGTSTPRATQDTPGRSPDGSGSTRLRLTEPPHAASRPIRVTIPNAAPTEPGHRPITGAPPRHPRTAQRGPPAPAPPPGAPHEGIPLDRECSTGCRRCQAARGAAGLLPEFPARAAGPRGALRLFRAAISSPPPPYGWTPPAPERDRRVIREMGPDRAHHQQAEHTTGQ